MKTLRISLIAAVCAVMSLQFASAQDISLGVRVGPGLSSFIGESGIKEIEGVTLTESNGFIFSYYGGISANIRVSDKFAIQPELLYALQGSATKQEAEFTSIVAEHIGIDKATTTTTRKLGYFKIPVLAKYYVVGEVGSGLGLYLGPQLSFKISEAGTREMTAELDGKEIELKKGEIITGTFDLEEEDFKAKNKDGEEVDGLNGLDVGLIVGADYEFDFGLSIGLRYDIGLMPVANQDAVGSEDTTFQNHTVSLSLAYLFSL